MVVKWSEFLYLAYFLKLAFCNQLYLSGGGTFLRPNRQFPVALSPFSYMLAIKLRLECE